MIMARLGERHGNCAGGRSQGLREFCCLLSAELLSDVSKRILAVHARPRSNRPRPVRHGMHQQPVRFPRPTLRLRCRVCPVQRPLSSKPPAHHLIPCGVMTLGHSLGGHSSLGPTETWTLDKALVFLNFIVSCPVGCARVGLHGPCVHARELAISLSPGAAASGSRAQVGSPGWRSAPAHTLHEFQTPAPAKARR